MVIFDCLVVDARRESADEPDQLLSPYAANLWHPPRVGTRPRCGQVGAF